MNRSRAITAILSLILVACAAVIFMDQNGMLGAESPVSQPRRTPVPSTPGPSAPTPEPAPGDSGYGGLK